MNVDPAARADAAAPSAAGDRRLARSITATWWYTATAVIFFEVAYVLLATAAVVEAGGPGWAVSGTGLGGLVWCAAQLPLILSHRHRDDAAGAAQWRLIAAPLVVSLAYAALAGASTGLWVVAGYVVLQPLVLLNWPRGVRLRLTVAVTAVLVAAWIVDQRHVFSPDGPPAGSTWSMVGYFSAILPAMLVLSLWWWDVLVALDKARAAEARLAATQERLRVATDVHDLQGHHLQVIALQLELAERLMGKDQDAALEQLRLARGGVDEARQGTRDLATRFRSVPLSDEIANAADLLRAAGIAATARVDVDADLAPAPVLGPVIRETTTNALRHGGGRRAALSLTRAGSLWLYEIANDAPDDPESADGSGLEGVARRAAEAGGTVEVLRSRGEFRVVVTVPAAPDRRGHGTADERGAHGTADGRKGVSGR